MSNPPGDDNVFQPNPDSQPEEKHEEKRLLYENPEISQWACLALLAITVVLMAVTAEWLVDSIEGVEEEGHIQPTWFGLILLPLASFSADGAVTIGYFIHATYRALRGRSSPPAVLAKAREIDMSIQFMLFWLPFLVLIAWWTNRPLTLLFDFFHVALLLAASFLVNYVTADAKTNWAEGVTMIAFYIIIVSKLAILLIWTGSDADLLMQALGSWYYPGQPEIGILSRCTSVVASLHSTASGAEAGDL